MIIPVGHRILVEVDQAELELEWNVDGESKKFEIVSDQKLEQAAVTSGKLVGMGNQAWKAFGPDFTGERWAQLGDQVFFARYAGNFIEDPETGKNYKIMNDEDIVAVVGKENG